MKKRGKYLTVKRAKGYLDPPWPEEGFANWYFRTGLIMGWSLCNEEYLKKLKMYEKDK